MQPKGVINFNNQNKNSKKVNEETVKKLFNEVFSVDQTNSDTTSKSEEQAVEQAQEDAHKDFLKESSKEQEKSVQKLDDLTKVANLILFRVKSINPIDLFPDEIIIDTNKISIIHRTFFASERIHSVMVKDVSDVFVDTGLFFARLSIVDSGFVENEVAVEYLGKDDAIRARRIIQGLVVAQGQEIDFTKLQQELNNKQIIEKIEILGKAKVGN